MQAAIDGVRDGGVVEAPRMAKPPFIEPAHLKPELRMSGDAPIRSRQQAEAFAVERLKAGRGHTAAG
jgi:hypothetical protein